MGTNYVVTDASGNTGWHNPLASAFLSASLLCCFELMIFIVTWWNNNSKIYFWSISLATFSSLCYTLGVLVYLFAPFNAASEWISIILSCFGYWAYTPSEFMVMYTRLHLLRPTRNVMLACKIMLIAEWILVTTPNFILSFAALASTGDNFTYAYSWTQRIEPAVYGFVSLTLSGLYLYYAIIMFKRYGDKKVRSLLSRLLCANIFLMALGVGNVVAEFAGGGIVQSTYVALLYSFQLKIEFWMLNDIGLLASETLERSRILKPLKIESVSDT